LNKLLSLLRSWSDHFSSGLRVGSVSSVTSMSMSSMSVSNNGMTVRNVSVVNNNWMRVLLVVFMMFVYVLMMRNDLVNLLMAWDYFVLALVVVMQILLVHVGQVKVVLMQVVLVDVVTMKIMLMNVMNMEIVFVKMILVDNLFVFMILMNFLLVMVVVMNLMCVCVIVVHLVDMTVMLRYFGMMVMMSIITDKWWVFMSSVMSIMNYSSAVTMSVQRASKRKVKDSIHSSKATDPKDQNRNGSNKFGHF
jgi:hypothetical protein